MEFYEQIFSGHDPDMEYTLSGLTYGKIYELAAGIKNLASENESLCLCTNKKELIVASLLASVCGGPSVILPHSCSAAVIEEIRETIGFEFILSDLSQNIHDLKIITPGEIKGTVEDLSYARDPDSVFLKMFTGGSTGKPKVWNKTPKNVLGEALYHSNSLKISKNDIVVSSVPPQHIYGLLFSVLAPFISSARVMDEIPLYPQEILSSIKNYGGTILVSVPIHYRALKNHSFTLPELRLALSSSGSLDFEDAKYFFSQTGLPVAEVFGSTETGGIALRYNSGELTEWKPFKGIEWKTDGENLSVLSEFISPELPRDRGGFYITEDRIEKGGDAGFFHLGRADSIVKVAGKRVDLGEIEVKLKKMPGVTDAVVISVSSPGARGNEILAVVEGNVNQAGVRRYAKDNLESYAVPKKIRLLDKIPRSPSGKCDREKLEDIFHLSS